MAKKNKTPDTIDLPEVKDIPGQEHVKPPYIGEMADTTASSADEEGDDILEPDEDGLDIEGDTDADVTAEERTALRNFNRNVDSEDELLEDASLDDVDEDGEPLNEKSRAYDLSGEDLDTPGIEEDDSEDVE